MDRTRTTMGALLTIGLLLLASACAGRTGTDAGNPNGDSGIGTDGVSIGGTGLGSDCDDTGGPPTSTVELTRLPADAVLVAATRCVFEIQVVPGDGEWEMKLEQRADGALDALAAALRRPDEPTGRNQACTAIGYVPIIITVTDQQGRQIKPRLPMTACGGPLPAATSAIAALHWSTVKTSKARQTRTELEVSSGCPGQYKPMIAIVASDAGARPGPLAASPNLPASALQVCRYALDPTSTLTMAGSPPVAMGRLSSASTLDTAAAGAFLAAIAAAPAAAACDQPQAPFALVFGHGAVSPNVAVELGGCYRALVESDSSGLRQLDAAGVSAIVA